MTSQEVALRKLSRHPTATEAEALAEVLLGEAIDTTIQPEDDAFAVWIVDDPDLDDAREIARAWAEQPDAPRFAEARERAKAAREREAADARRRTRTAERQDRAQRPIRVGPVTILTLLIATGLTLIGIPSLDQLGDAIVGLPGADKMDWAFVDDLRLERGPDGLYVPFLGAVRSGEIWRLFTPMFVHVGGLLHLGFNGYWVWIFGSQIETRKGSLALLLMILVFGSLSTVAQYAVGWSMLDVAQAIRGIGGDFTWGPIYLGGPLGGGLSGALYGMFGYVWAKSATDKFSGIGIDSSTVGLLVIWFLVCLTGTVGPIANIAHGAGLALGMLWGALGHRLNKRW
ncbi:MAG: rhomboid family intramembrane serine protease [Deltaproteobacteria bacterium]|nr:MAG: rhomboid family intramembrane serine protease [Deltaproteobacteria bacterium]